MKLKAEEEDNMFWELRVKYFCSKLNFLKIFLSDKIFDEEQVSVTAIVKME